MYCSRVYVDSRGEILSVHRKLVPTGGGFGGKEDLTVQGHAAVFSYHLNRPVRIRLNREESIRMHPDQETLKAMMEEAGFEDCEYFNLTGGIVALHRGYKF